MKKIIFNIKNKSPGVDNLPISVFRDNFDLFGPVIVDLINKSLSQGIFPAELKMAKIVPIHKSGEKCRIENYRPISLLPVFSKILEKVVGFQMDNYLTSNNLISRNQYGFRPKLSTEMAMHALTDYIYTSFDESKYALGIFIDLSKAFDSLNRTILLKKLEYYGFRTTENKWFASYLANRTQVTEVGGATSGYEINDTGVAQGSILSPMLFNLYINDIINSSKLLSFYMYADDTCVIAKSDDINQLILSMNDEINNVSKWLSDNHLTLNVGKTNYVIFHRDRKPVPNISYDLKINSKVVNRISEVKFLGVIIDECLKFNSHIVSVTKKISKFSIIFYKIRKLLANKNLVDIYHALVYPSIIYGISVWGSACKTKLECLRKIQKRIVKTICGADRIVPSAPLLTS